MKSNSRVLRGWRDFGVKATAIILAILLATQMVGTPAFASGALTNKQASEDIATTVDDTGVESSGTEATDTTVPDEAAGTESDPAPADSTQATEEPVAETTESATDPATETPAADPAANVVSGTESEPAADSGSEPAPAVEQDQLASIKLDLADSASITFSKDGNKIDDDTNPVDVPANEELKFTAQAADGWQIDAVKTVIDGVETELTADANGEYKVVADKVTDALTVKVEAVEVAEDPAADVTDGEPTSEVLATDETNSDGASLMSLAAAPRAAGQNSWKTSDFGITGRYLEGVLYVGKHYFKGSDKPLGGTTSVKLNTCPSYIAWGDADQEASASALALPGYDFDHAEYNGVTVLQFRISESGDLQYRSKSNGNWQTVSNPDQIVFYYEKAAQSYQIEWYVNGNLVETTQANAGDQPSFGRQTQNAIDTRLRQQLQSNSGSEVVFAGWATSPNSQDFKSSSDLPDVEGNAKYYAVFKARAFFYFVLPGFTTDETGESAYMYAGNGEVIVPDGYSFSSADRPRWYNTAYPVSSYIIEAPTDGEIREGLKTYYDGKDGKLTYSDDWNYEITWVTFTSAFTSVGYKGSPYFIDEDWAIHLDTSITIETNDEATLNYIITMPNGDPITQSKVHKKGDNVEINNSVETDKQYFHTDGYRYQSTSQGYKFDGWYTDPDYIHKAEGSIEVDNTRTFYARYISETYTLTYDANEGVFADGEESHESKRTADRWVNVSDAEEPERDGYKFVGWSSDDVSINNGGFSMPEKDVTLVAQWEKALNEGDEITVEVYHNGAKVSAEEYIELASHKNGSGVDSTTGFVATPEDQDYKVNFTYEEFNCADIDLDLIKNMVSGDYVVEISSSPSTTENGDGSDSREYSKKVLEENASWFLDNVPGGATVKVEIFNLYDVAYTDGVEGEEIFADQKNKDIKYGGNTPAFKGTPTRDGYKFIGWEPKVAETVTNDATYVAQWEANEAKIVFVENGGTPVDDMTGKTDQAIANTTMPTTTKDGYKFEGWYTKNGIDGDWGDKVEVLPSAFPVGTTTYYAKWTANTDTKYTVEYYYQANGQYPEAATSSVERSGTTDADCAVTAEDKVPNDTANYAFDGEAANVLDGTIAGDGSTVLKVYFKQQITVTYAPGEHGTFEQQVKDPVDYNDPTPAFEGETTGELGWTFGGWTPSVAENATENVTYTARWTANTDTKYTVRHWFQNVDNDDYAQDLTTYPDQILEGTTDQLTNAQAHQVTGFTANEFVQKTIAGDETTVVDIYYDRNVYTVTYQVIGSYFANEDYSHASYRYGANLTLIANDMTQVGYVWSGWSGLPSTMPADNVTVTGFYSTADNTAYTVRHWFQNVDDDGYSQDPAYPDQSMTGTTGESTAAQAHQVTGFVAQEITQQTIAADGTTIVDVYYDRSVYDVDYLIVGDYFATPEGDVYSSTIGVRYGAALQLIADDMQKTGFIWNGWTGLPATMPADNVTVTGYYTADTANLAIEGYSDTYDGLTHGVTVSGTLDADEVKYFDVDGNEIDNQFVNVTDGAISVTVVVSRDGYEIWSGAATVQITPAPLTVVTQSAAKIFDGIALTAPGEVTGFVNGETADWSITGAITMPGQASNTYNIDWASENTTALETNYAIDSETIGKLTVYPQSIDPNDPDPDNPDPEDPDPTDPDPENPDQPFYNGVKVTAPEDVYYNGLSQEQAPVVTDRDGNPIDPSYYDVTYSEDTVNAGTVTITVTGKNGYTGSTQVTYNILMVNLPIATPSAGKVFDGAPLNGGQPTASGWQDDDAAQVTLTATGSITNVGSAYNTYTVSDPDGVLNNYNIIDSLGVLAAVHQPDRSWRRSRSRGSDRSRSERSRSRLPGLRSRRSGSRGS